MGRRSGRSPKKWPTFLCWESICRSKAIDARNEGQPSGCSFALLVQASYRRPVTVRLRMTGNDEPEIESSPLCTSVTRNGITGGNLHPEAEKVGYSKSLIKTAVRPFGATSSPPTAMPIRSSHGLLRRRAFDHFPKASRRDHTNHAAQRGVCSDTTAPIHTQRTPVRRSIAIIRHDA
jgi:hypothetical protein